MTVFQTRNGKGIYLSDSELLALGFIAINLLGQTGYSFLDDYAEKTVGTLLSEYQLAVLHDLLDAIRKERLYG